MEVVKWEVEESQGTESAAKGKRLNRPEGCAVLGSKGEVKRKMCIIPALTACLDLFYLKSETIKAFLVLPNHGCL